MNKAIYVKFSYSKNGVGWRVYWGGVFSSHALLLKRVIDNLDDVEKYPNLSIDEIHKI